MTTIKAERLSCDLILLPHVAVPKLATLAAELT